MADGKGDKILVDGGKWLQYWEMGMINEIFLGTRLLGKCWAHNLV